MAQIYGNPGPEWGDQFVYEALSKLPDDLIIYPQPKLAYKRQTPRYPDYAIVYPKKGVIILEVKDWVEIIEYDRNSATIRRRDGSEATESSPVEQARAAAHLLENILKADENLVRDQGKLRFPYAYAGVLPHQPTQVIQQLEREWGEGFIFGKDDLQPEKLMKRLQEIPTPFNCRMFEHEVRIACATIKPGNKRIDRATGQFKGLIDRNQEKIAREPIAARPDASERRKREATQPALDFQEKVNIPAEVTELTTKLNVRLVRGFAGTGKTDVLILRAEFLHEQYPDSDILVTTFNDPVYANRLLPELKHLQPKVDIIKFTSLCTPIYKTRHEWRKPQSVEGVVAKLESENSLVKDFGVAFLADEFKWMKETERAKRNVYVLKIREGRGGPEGRTLGKAMKNSVFDLFEIYQGMLQKINAHDWEDIYEKTLECLRDGIEPEKKYDVILID
ncbi:MAG: NERD domain-containing protein [Anaerolineales bacterium]|nr:NERD domain-containing protein [Anaerolineales bacterium]